MRPALFLFLISVVAEATTLPLDHPFAKCASCHGDRGEGNEDLKAPRLAGQDPVYLWQQIEAFRKGWRKKTEAAEGMTAIAKVYPRKVFEAAFEYLSAVQPAEKRDRVFGLRLQGEYLYRANCAICHGDQGEGSEYHMPVLNMQHGWYLREQLNAFRSGLRGHDSADQSGTTMAFYARLLKDEGEVRDVAAFLSSLKPKAD